MALPFAMTTIMLFERSGGERGIGGGTRLSDSFFHLLICTVASIDDVVAGLTIHSYVRRNGTDVVHSALFIQECGLK